MNEKIHREFAWSCTEGMSYRIARNFRGIKFLRNASHETFVILFSRIRPAIETAHAQPREIKNFVD